MHGCLLRGCTGNMRLVCLVLVVCLAGVGVSVEVDVGVEVVLQQGRLRGNKEVLEDGRHYYTFLGIPYAQPPIGDLKFKAPVRAGGWKGLRDERVQPEPCLQPGSSTDNVLYQGSEDCLYLNIFTPNQTFQSVGEGKGGLAVMVYLHGGSFIRGSIKDYNPKPLLSQGGVVVVTVQYRLGVYGFLSTEDEVLPGNLGLRDQTEALRWVKDNIHKFGGDPNRVTLFGESAGAGSVHLQVLSPHAKGLFQRAILQSGTALCPWSIGQSHREMAFKLGRLLNCTTVDNNNNNSTQLVACLSKTPFSDIVLASSNLAEWFIFPVVAVPRVDGDFLPDYPANILASGFFNHVDMISGITRDEGIYSTLSLYTKFKPELELLSTNFSHTAPLALSLTNEESPEYLALLAMLKYLPHLHVIDENDMQGLTQLVTDQSFKSCHWSTVAFQSRTNRKVYQYMFEHRGQYSFTQLYNTTLASTHVSHGDDLFYLFDGLLPHATLTHPEDLFVRHVITQLWTNFATTGNPTQYGSLGFRWTPQTPYKWSDQPSSPYLSISTTPGMKSPTTAEIQNQEFWRRFPTKSNKILFPELFLEE
ncbi:hypothetical protein Pcinc_008964 [Petrolisthes cinctipes]|uniref:Carboxylic ester hydrolase n=1 Tax=Petrolisthes cinctipes TaxID=88211 RepID=A0AAE1GC68_PETCI|nr:hypothetical protein Pcinc_008964 [Petrolisthes cinctipes]